MTETIYVDLSNYMVKYAHVFKNLSFNGQPTGIYYGLLKLTRSLLLDKHNYNIVFCRDGYPTRRRKLYNGYKANRDEIGYKPTRDMTLTKNIQSLLCSYPRVSFCYDSTYEADDIIASLALQIPEQSIIFSGDNDFLQLLKYGVRIAHSYKENKLIYHTEEYIKERFGATKDTLILHRVLQGDKSDNIKPVLSRIRTADVEEFTQNWLSFGYDKAVKQVKNKNFKEQLELGYENIKLNAKLMSLSKYRTYPLDLKTYIAKTDETLFDKFGLQKWKWNEEDVEGT